MEQDQWGNHLTTGSPTAAGHFNAAVEQFLEFRLDAGENLKALLSADPDCVMGHCLKGYFLSLFYSKKFNGKIAESLEAARHGLTQASAREQAHVAALAAWSGGDWQRAIQTWSEILANHPRDILAVRLQHQLIFWKGQSLALRAAAARVFDSWDEGFPGYNFLLGMLAFAQEECGDYGEAEANGRRAVALNPQDLWSIHAVAHVMEMQGRSGEGLAWLDYPLDAFDDRNPFKGHLWWHRALFALEKRDFDQVLDLYDRVIYPQESDLYSDIFNAASLLWRLTFEGVTVGDRWQMLAESASARRQDTAMAFTDIHVMMALAAAGRWQDAADLLQALREASARDGSSEAIVYQYVAVPLAEAILAYGQDDLTRSIELFEAVSPNLPIIGGSHAQRDVFQLFLVEALCKAGRLPMARAVLAERVILKPTSHNSWIKYAKVLKALGDQEKAEEALSKAEGLAA